MTSYSFSPEQILQLPYVEFVPADGRTITIHSYFDHGAKEWHLYLPVGPGKLGRVAGGETVSGSYLATFPEGPERDMGLPLGTLITRHLSFPEILPQLASLESDIQRCAAVLEKYHLIWSISSTRQVAGPLLVQSELEYLLFLLRSLYDCMQGVIRELARRLIVLDGSGRRAVQRLPRSFADVALTGDHPTLVEQIESRWGVPTALAHWYFTEAPFFYSLRKLRDEIAHHGASPPQPFQVGWGFAVDPGVEPWSAFDYWPRDQLWQGRLGSLQALFVGLIARAIGCTSAFANIIGDIVSLPKTTLKADVRLFLRSPFGARLVSLEATREHPWESLD